MRWRGLKLGFGQADKIKNLVDFLRGLAVTAFGWGVIAPGLTGRDAWVTVLTIGLPCLLASHLLAGKGEKNG